MKTNQTVALAIIGLIAYNHFGGWAGIQYRLHPQQRTIANEQAAKVCDDKDFCVTVYVAPWCSVCHASEPTFRMLDSYFARKHPSTALKIVIGDASAGKNGADQVHLRPLHALTDDSGEILRSHDIHAFPTWIVTNRAGQEIFRKAAGLSLSGDEQAEMFYQDVTAKR